MRKFIITSLMLLAFPLFAQKKSETSPKQKRTYHHANQFTIGVGLGFGYNVINHIDGTLQVIPNHSDPIPKPGSPVYSSMFSIQVDAPILALEYWFNPSVSIRNEMAINLIVAGSNHEISAFAYIFSYFKIDSGARYYFDSSNLGFLFLGAGLFVSFPINEPKIGFESAKSGSLITGGPYAEIGVNYPVSQTVSIEANLRFSFAVGPYSKKENEAILATVALSPIEVIFGVNWVIF